MRFQNVLKVPSKVYTFVDLFREESPRLTLMSGHMIRSKNVPASRFRDDYPTVIQSTQVLRCEELHIARRSISSEGRDAHRT